MSENKGPHKGGFPWQYKDHHFYGYSIAGVSTSLVYENQKIAFDIAQGLQFNIPCHHYFITHGHSDHAGGLCYVLSQRSMWGLPPAKIYVPPHYYDNFLKLIQLWHEIEGFHYEFELKAIAPGDRVVIDSQSAVEVFETFHRVPSQGYCFVQQKKKLKPELEKLSQPELLDYKKTHPELHQIVDERVFAFTGDTTIDFLQNFNLPVKVLFMESTFIDEAKPISAARQWGHTHLDEIVSRLEQIPAEKIMLIHFSARYRQSEILKALQQKVSPELRTKVDIFPRPF